MIQYSMSLSKIYVLLNKVLNKLIKKEFGKQYSIRLNSLCFIANRTDLFYFYPCSEKITLKSLKPTNSKELNLITSFLLFHINSALMCIDTANYMEVVDVEITIL